MSVRGYLKRTFQFTNVHEILFGAEDVNCLDNLGGVVAEFLEFGLGESIDLLKELGLTTVIVLR